MYLNTEALLRKVFIFVVSIVLLCTNAKAQQIELMKKPSDFIFTEITAGSVGAIVGGFIGQSFLTPYLRTLLNIPECRPFYNGYVHDCEIPQEISYIFGSTLGSSLLVIATGSRNSVKGSLISTFIGAGIGSYMGIKIAEFIIRWASNQFFGNAISIVAWVAIFIADISIVGLVPGTLATIGFNLGATMEVKMLSVFSDRLELVGAQFRW